MKNLIITCSGLLLPGLLYAQSMNTSSVNAELSVTHKTKPKIMSENISSLNINSSIGSDYRFKSKNKSLNGNLRVLISPFVNHSKSTTLTPTIGGEIIDKNTFTQNTSKPLVGATLSAPKSTQMLLVNPYSKFRDMENNVTNSRYNIRLQGIERSVRYTVEKQLSPKVLLIGSAEAGILSQMAVGDIDVAHTDEIITTYDYPNTHQNPELGPHNVNTPHEITTYEQYDDITFRKVSDKVVRPKIEMPENGTIVRLNLGVQAKLGQKIYLRPEMAYVNADYTLKETYLNNHSETNQYKIHGLNPKVTLGVRFN